MKKIFILAVVLVALVSTAFAAPPSDISTNVISAFNKRFSDAQQVEWTAAKDFYRVKFISQEQLMYAYFEPGGRLMAVTRNVTIKQLPIGLSEVLETKYEGFWIADIFEVSADGESTYYATMRNKKCSIVLQASAGGSWRIYKKEKI